MIETWLSTDWEQAWLVAVSAVAIVTAVVLVSRLLGLRTFSKMSSFDFAITVATGSLIASVAASSTSLANGAIALAVLYLCQFCLAQARRRTRFGSLVIDNRPLVLMIDGVFLEENLTSSRVTRDDVLAKLRAANVLHLADVRAVILETTGDVSVLHGEDAVDAELLAGVRGFDAEEDIATARPGQPIDDPERATRPR